MKEKVSARRQGMQDHSQTHARNDMALNIPAVQPDHEKLVLENEGLQSALDVLIKKVADQEISFRGSLSKSEAWGALQEQRATQATALLDAILNSPSWRAVSGINRRLDRFPRLRIFIRRSLKLLVWSARGQLPAKVRQFREVRKLQAAAPNSAAVSDYVDKGPLWVAPTTLPLPLVDEVLCFMKASGPVHLVLALNFYAGGGAESVALDYARAYAENNKDRSVLILLTDNGPKRKLPPLPANIKVVDLTGLTPDMNAREDHLLLLLRSVPLNTLHIVNSVVAFNLLKRLPKSFVSDINVIASVYCLQFDSADDTRIIGYGHDYLPSTIDKIDCVVTDNHKFSVEGPLRLGLAEHAHKFRVVYNKSKLDQTMRVDDSLLLLSSRLTEKTSGSRLTVHWAGRLDRQKRPDLLAEIAGLTADFCDFQVFGGSVVDGDYEALLREKSNIRLCGPYRSPAEWDATGRGNVFLFTSREEGMPNALIEASYLGYPIVASDVGGVGELVNDQTGWAVDKFAPASVYADALRQIFSDQSQAKNRTEQLIKLVHRRHNKQSYLKALAEIPGYERAS
jgi:glycosyltransferase involved in cell wall biosynthesis